MFLSLCDRVGIDSYGRDLTHSSPLPRKQKANELLSLPFDIKAVWMINAGDFQNVNSGLHKESLKTPSQYSCVSCGFIPIPPLWYEK